MLLNKISISMNILGIQYTHMIQCMHTNFMFTITASTAITLCRDCAGPSTTGGLVEIWVDGYKRWRKNYK